MIQKTSQSPRLKKFGKIRLGSKLLLGLIHGLSFRIQRTGLIFYLEDFHVRNWRILGFMRTRLNIEPCSPLKLTKVGFIFIGPNFLSRAEPAI